MIIFLDESGDLGFDFSKKGTSSVFLITLLVCRNGGVAKGIRKAVERALKNKIRRKAKRRKVEELKGSKDRVEVLEYAFEQMPNDGWGIYSIIGTKKNVEGHLRTKEGRHKFYNYLARLLLDKINFSGVKSGIQLIVDRSKRGDEVRDFDRYLSNQLEGKLDLDVPLDINHLDSKADKGLQAVDIFSWGIYRKYESNDQRFYKVIYPMIRFEQKYFKNKKPR